MNTSEIGTWLLGNELASVFPLKNQNDLLSLQEAESLARQKLQAFARSSDFSVKMKVAFGEEIDLTKFQTGWAARDFSALPRIEVRSHSDINGANGAYARAIDTIFISQEFLNQNAGNVDAIASVLLEEIGHAVDAALNSTDSPGDEGAIFSALVQGKRLSPEQLASLKAEDDTAIVTLDGQTLQIEQASISWIGNSGDWYDPANWSTGVVPSSGDDVTINRSGINLTVTFSQGNPNVRSLSLFALNGSVLTLSGLTSYTGPTLNLSPTIEASGAGSRIDLSSLTTLTGTTGLSGTVNLNAKAGGTIDLSNLTETATGRIAFLADGSNSVVDLSSLTNFGNVNYASSLIARNGGTVQADNLNSLKRVTLTLDGTGNFSTSQIATFTDGSLVIVATNPDLSNLTNIDRSSLLASNGGSLVLPLVTSYTGPTSNTNTTIEASGVGSRIDLSSLITLIGTTGLSGTVNLNAKAGGTLDLSNLTETATGRIAFLADGSNTVVDLSSLTNFGNVNYASSLIARNGGTMQADNLTSLKRVTLTLDGTGNFSTSQIATFTDGSLVIVATNPDLSNLTNIDRSSLLVSNGGSLVLPLVTNYTGPTSNTNTTIEASGVGSRIDLSSLITLVGTTGVGSGTVNLNAKDGANLDLSEINRVFGGRVQVLSDGSNSVIELSKLATNSFVTRNEQNGGLIAIVEPTDLENLGTVAGSKTISDSVGKLDPADLYRFELATNRNLSFFLNEIGASVSHAELLDSNGNLLTQIDPSGNQELLAGTYYLWVYQPVGNADYNLELSTAGIADGAGNTLDTARNLGILTGTQTINGFVGDADPKDLFRFQITNSSNFSLLLDGLAADADVQLLDSSGNFLASSSRGGTGSESLTAKLNPGVYYVEIDRHSGNTEYNLQLTSTSATAAPFQIVSFTPDYGSNRGNTTITVVGNQFTPNATLSLIDANGVERLAHQTVWYNDTTLVGTFNLTGLTTGAYDLKLNDTAGTITKPDIFSVNNGTPGKLEVFLSTPASIQRGNMGIAPANTLAVSNSLFATSSGQRGEVTVTYRNTGNTDIIAPLLRLEATGGKLQGFGEEGFTETSIQFLGINDEGAAGILPPGATRTISFKFQPNNDAINVDFTLNQIDRTATIDWAALKDESRPEFIPVDAWDALWQNFTTSAGNTARKYEAMLAENATHLSESGKYVADVTSLLAFEVLQGSNYGSIENQYSLGAFGRGGFLPWEITAIADSEGNVSVGLGGSFRFFQLQADGSYQPSVGDYGTLTLEGSSYRLREKDGTIAQFLPNGKLDYVEDTNGNRVRVTYTGDRITSVTDANGYSLSFTYNTQGRVSQITDDANRITTYTYDATGEHLLSVSDPLNQTTSYTYNPNHSVSRVTLDDGTQASFTYNSQGRLIRESLTNGAEPITYTYDTTGKVTATDADGNTNQLWLTDLGQISRLQDPLDRVIQFEYDENGNLTQLTAPDNTISRFTYDDRGNLLTQVDPLGYTVKFAYEPTFNQLTSVRDQKNNLTAYSYDGQGNLTGITYTDGSNELFSYDTKGNVTEWVNRRGDSLTYTYDDRNQLLTYSYVDTPQVDFTYDYDAIGNLISATDDTGTITLDYDDVDRLTNVTYPDNRTIEYSYDTVGRLTQLIYPDGYEVNYTYDRVGRLQSLTDGNGVTLVSYNYDAVGRLVRENHGNGTYTTYTYDAAGQLTDILNYAPNNILNSSFEYAYDNLGRRIGMTTLEGTWAYGYDATGQLISVISPTGGLIEYEYDPAGNRIKVIDNGVTTNYSTNNLNQYTSVGNITYTYDADGNLIAKGNDTTYTYNDENRLVEVVTPDGTWEYEYDALGNRTATIHNGVRTEYLVDPTGLGDVIAEYDSNGNLTARYIHGLGLEIRLDGTNGASYYDFDALGSTVGLTGLNGQVVNSYSYLPFGEDLTKNETVANPFEYVGQWGVMDEGNGLDFMRARYYHSTTGVFITIDPLRIPLLGSYDYSTNNPTQLIDPTGLQESQESPLNQLLKGYRDQDQTVAFTEIVNAAKNNQNGNLENTIKNSVTTFDKGNAQVRANSTAVSQGLVTQSFSGLVFGPPKDLPGAVNTLTGVPLNPKGASQNLIKTTVPKAVTGTGNPSVINKPFWQPIVDALNNLSKQTCGKGSSGGGGGGGGGGSADTQGDPHLTTFDGQRYDLQAAGEFTLFKSTTGDLTVQVRQEPVSVVWGGKWVSINTAVATLVDGKRVGLYVNEAIPLKIDGIATDLADGASLSLGTGRIERHKQQYTIIYPTGDRIDVGLYSHSVIGNYININTYIADGREGEIVGILGNNNGDSSDDFTLADGTVLTPPLNFEQLYGQFANSWRITQAKSLFDYNSGEDTNTFTDTTFPSQFFTIDDLPPDKRALAEQIVQQLGITDPTLLANAILDIALTDGDPAFIDGVADQNRLLIASADNTLIGPSGTGARGWLSSEENLPYQVYFTNPSDSTTTVATVTITEQLDPDLNWNTLQLGDLGFGNIWLDLPDGRQTYSERLDLQAQIGYFVDVSGKLDPDTGELSWTLVTIDPATGAPPTAPNAGFLAPNSAGFVSYTVQPQTGLPTGTQITAEAAITFNQGDPNNTFLYLNTIDLGIPSSNVNALPATVSNPNFTVSWAGTDDGSGIADYDIYVSVDGTPFTLWLNNTTATEATYIGENSRSYAFYSIARDRVGHIEADPIDADTQTTVIAAVNNHPVTEADKTVTVDEDAAPTSLNIAAPTDADNDPLTITVNTLPDSTKGEVQLSDGTDLVVNQTLSISDLTGLIFVPLSNANGAAGTFNYTVSDGKGGTDSQIVTLGITPVNDPATITGTTTATVTEDTNVDGDGKLNATGTLTVSDVDAGEDKFNITVTSATGNLGSLSISEAGNFSYSVDNSAIQSLGQDLTKIDTFTVQSFDGTASQDITVTITGVNDLATISGTATATVTEDTNVDGNGKLNATGTLTVSDVDAGEDKFNTTVTSATGNIGSLSISEAGNFSYSVDNSAVQSLGQDLTKIDTFTVQSFDGTANQEIAITIVGVNDIPTLQNAIADQNATANQSFNFTFAQDTFSDVDAGDTLTYSATLENGDPLPDWLSFDAATRTFSGTPTTSDTGSINIQVTASDSQNATAVDVFSLTVAVSNLINGDDTDNTLSGTPEADIINGFGGNDYITGLAGNDTIDGGTGKFDRMFGNDGDDTIIDPDGVLGAHGKANNDTINVTFASSWDNDSNPTNAPRSDGKITGGYGDDNITVTMNNSKFFINLKGDEPTNSSQDGNDVVTLLGRYQNAVIDLGGGNDTFNGGSGSDNISGKAGNDILLGNGGNDQLAGNNGNDTLVGGAGNDKLTGGCGQDNFSFSSPNEKIDSITDFKSVDDTISVDDTGFGGGLAVGTLLETQFVLGTAAADTSDRFIYNQSTGALFFDIDGTGATAKIQIATLTTKPVISFEDIVVI
jgi:RHS repeat-associated protein